MRHDILVQPDVEKVITDVGADPAHLDSLLGRRAGKAVRLAGGDIRVDLSLGDVQIAIVRGLETGLALYEKADCFIP